MTRTWMVSVLIGMVVTAGWHTAAIAQGPIEQVLAATFRLSNNGKSSTAFLVWPKSGEAQGGKRAILVTAGHALKDTPDAKATLVLRAKNDDSTYCRQEVTIPVRDGKQCLFVCHPDLDIAALPIDLPEATAIEPLRYEQLAAMSFVEEGKLKVASEVFVPGYPATLEGNEVGWSVLRKGIIATHPLVPVQKTPKIMVNAATFGGDSGAPVVLVDGDRAVVVGIVVGMQRQTDRASMSFQEYVSHMPMALAITLQAPFIRETIDLLGKAEAAAAPAAEPAADAKEPADEAKQTPEAKLEPAS